MHRYNLIPYRVNIHAKPWCIVGSGPSITNLSDPQRYNIWAINHSIEHLKRAEVLSIFDHEAFLEIDYRKYDYDVLLTRIISLSHVDLEADNLCFVEFEVDSFRMNNIRFFDGPVSAQQNSASFAVCALGEFGVKNVFLAGIDGGKGRHPMFAHHPSNGNKDNRDGYDRHFLGCQYWADHFKMTMTKL